MEPARAGRAGGRRYRLRDAAVLLACAAATLLLLEADGLHAWASRMAVGPAQERWLSVVEPWRATAARAGLTAPRRWAREGVDRLGAALSGDASTADLLARGWQADASGKPWPADAPAAPDADADAPAPGLEAVPPSATPPAADAPAPRPDPDPRATVLLIGDSLMVTLAAAVARDFAESADVEVVAAPRAATGLSRPDVYDWPGVASALLAVHRPLLVVCVFGGNDAQDVRPEKQVVRYGTAEWDALYQVRVRALMNALTVSGAEVLWLGLPPMRAPGYDARMRHLNALFREEAGRVAGVTYQDTAAAVAGKDGRYASFLRGRRGRLVRVRHEDGIHYVEDGARRVAVQVDAWIEQEIGARAVQADAEDEADGDSEPVPEGDAAPP